MFKDKMADSDIQTLVGANASVTGDIAFKGGVHVDGEVDGSVVADGDGLLMISERGVVRGEVRAPRVVIDGTVDGDVTASERLELHENARVTGNLRYATIEMRLGATVDGQLQTLGDAQPAPRKVAQG